MKKRDPDLLLFHAPLLRQGMTTPNAMRDVLYALAPVTLASLWFFGISAALILASCIAGAILAEWLFANRETRGESLRDASGILTGLLLGLTLPPGLPLWMAFLGGFVAISLLVIGATQRQTSRNKLASLANSTLVETQRAVQIRLEETVKARTFELEAVNDQLAKVSRVDGLTGAFNRRYFDDTLKDEVERSMRSSEPIGIVMIDLDHFKKLNDEHGHAAGDACLKEAARLAMHCAEAEDGIVARYGGEEFVAVLINANENKAMAFAERVREAIASYEVQYEEKILRMTASLGLFCDVAREKGDEDRLLREADEALYAAKDGGRNQVRIGGVALAIARAAAEENADQIEAESTAGKSTAESAMAPIV